MRDCEVLEKISSQCGRPSQCWYCKLWVTKKETGGINPFIDMDIEFENFCYFEIKPEYWNIETIKKLLESEDVSERVCEERKKRYSKLHSLRRKI